MSRRRFDIAGRTKELRTALAHVGHERGGIREQDPKPGIAIAAVDTSDPKRVHDK